VFVDNWTNFFIIYRKISSVAGAYREKINLSWQKYKITEFFLHIEYYECLLLIHILRCLKCFIKNSNNNSNKIGSSVPSTLINQPLVPLILCGTYGSYLPPLPSTELIDFLNFVYDNYSLKIILLLIYLFLYNISLSFSGFKLFLMF
jgi:hypothetical protein